MISTKRTPTLRSTSQMSQKRMRKKTASLQIMYLQRANFALEGPEVDIARHLHDRRATKTSSLLDPAIATHLLVAGNAIERKCQADELSGTPIANRKRNLNAVDGSADGPKTRTGRPLREAVAKSKATLLDVSDDDVDGNEDNENGLNDPDKLAKKGRFL
ncbi:hypothetical protein KIN20_019098 [Parelaphostrongylus tenuis]|uniref:Uncharacterized protein n=1 Tax=Parelaphostrongylus tenuis TaxID=148309 RepID=A0AAD5MR18_PARTN|nr:hypothetical protein KIN20_019098 [Parelaphostrongylus tenuis]